jgi:hypothetical protein
VTAAEIRACGITFDNADAPEPLDLEAVAARAAGLQRHAGTTDYAARVIADNVALLVEVRHLRTLLGYSR